MGTHEAATRGALLRAEYMLNACADAALRSVRRRFHLRERTAARRARMDAAAEALPLQRRFIRRRAIGAVAEHLL